MEHKSLWRNFLVLTMGSLLALHINVASAAGDNDEDTKSTDASDSCVLPAE